MSPSSSSIHIDKTNRGFCDKCNAVAPLHHVERDNKVYLVKECPTCGTTESCISSDARKYMHKREICGYQGEAESSCLLNCTTCSHGKPPSLVFVDVTNRCNMNCPICLANIPAMGFRFDPPIGYFQKIFEKLATIKPKPKIQLFGGEPTVREDLIEIIELARKYGLSARVVTNGLKLADEEYCKKLIKTGAQLMFGLDGLNPEIYASIRKNPNALERKKQALENIRKHRKSKVTIMCTTGDGVNDKYIGELVQYCHDNRSFISALDMIPIVATWGPEEVAAQTATIEDVERIMANAVAGTEFVPAGLLRKLKNLQEAFKLRLTFGGAHPNCESISVLISDGQQYNSANQYLKHGFEAAVVDATRTDEGLTEKLKSSFLVKTLGDLGRVIVVGLAYFGVARRHANMKAIFGSNSFGKILKIAFGLVTGKKMKNLLRTHTRCSGILRLMVLPFEELGCVESARLVECPAAFAYEHDNGGIRFMPVCTWPAHKNEILKKTAARWTQSGDEKSESEV